MPASCNSIQINHRIIVRINKYYKTRQAKMSWEPIFFMSNDRNVPLHPRLNSIINSKEVWGDLCNLLKEAFHSRNHFVIPELQWSTTDSLCGFLFVS